MKSLLGALVVLAIASTSAKAQRQELQFSMEQIIDVTMSSTFKNIKLTPQQRTDAIEIVRRMRLRRDSIPVTDPNYRKTLADHKVSLVEQLRSVLITEVDKQIFDANLKEEAARWVKSPEQDFDALSA